MPDGYTWIDGIKDITVLLGAWVAILSVVSWRRSFLGSRRLGLLQDALALFYEVQDVLVAVRSPLGFEGEGGARAPLPNEPPELRGLFDAAHLIVRRYEARAELLGKVRSLKYRLRAVVGEAASEPCDLINSAIRDVRSVFRRLSGTWLRAYQHARRTDNQARLKELIEEAESLIDGEEDGEDPVLTKAEEAVAALKRLCEAEGRPHGGLLRLLTRKGGGAPKNKN